MERFSQLHSLLGLTTPTASSGKGAGKGDVLKALGLYDAALDAITVTESRFDHDARSLPTGIRRGGDVNAHAVIDYIDRVLAYVNPTPTTTRSHGRTTTPLPTRTTTVTPIVKTRELGHGRPRDVLHYIDTIAYALADDYAAPYTGNAPIGRTRYDTTPDNDDALFDALRRAVLLRRDAPDANPDADIVPKSLATPTRRYIGHGVYEEIDSILSPTYEADDDVYARRTYPKGASTKREWGNLIRPTIRTLLGRGYTIDQIIDRLNA
jgi:hypothetical protein